MESKHDILKVWRKTKELIDRQSKKRGMTRVAFTDHAVKAYVEQIKQSEQPSKPAA